MHILEILSRRYDVEILLSKEDLSPDLRTRLSEELDRLDEEAETRRQKSSLSRVSQAASSRYVTISIHLQLVTVQAQLGA